MSRIVRLQKAEEGGFTLVELLVVVAVIGVLAGLLFPAIARAKNSGKVTACLNNVRQLQLAWTMYADDHNGRLVRNDFVIGNPHPSRASWVQGRLDYSRIRSIPTARFCSMIGLPCLRPICGQPAFIDVPRIAAS
jgi:prepilin-type N-terminal cleavage/methylation domain-containing protein